MGNYKIKIYNKLYDPSWDILLKSIFEIPVWDGMKSTKLAVKVVSKFSIVESNNIMENLTIEEIKEHLNYNRAFYK